MTLAEVLKNSGWTQEQIDALDAKAMSGLTSYMTGIEQTAAQKEKDHPHDPSTCPPNPDTAVPKDYKAPDYYPDDINYEPNYVTVTAGMIVTCIGPTGPQGNKGKELWDCKDQQDRQGLKGQWVLVLLWTLLLEHRDFKGFKVFKDFRESLVL